MSDLEELRPADLADARHVGPAPASLGFPPALREKSDRAVGAWRVILARSCAKGLHDAHRSGVSGWHRDEAPAGEAPRGGEMTGPAKLALLLFVAALVGCASPSVRSFMNPAADLSFYQRVGVVPFRSLAGDRLAGEKFSVEFNTALLASGLFEVVDYGVFVSQMSKIVGTESVSEALGADQVKEIAAAAGVQGIFVGTVTDYQMMSTPNGQFPVVTVEVRLLDAETSNVVWTATATERGGPKTPIVGFGEIHTLGELSQRIAGQLVSRLK